MPMCIVDPVVLEEKTVPFGQESASDLYSSLLINHCCDLSLITANFHILKEYQKISHAGWRANYLWVKNWYESDAKNGNIWHHTGLLQIYYSNHYGNRTI